MIAGLGDSEMARATAVLRVRSDAGHALRRRASSTTMLEPTAPGECWDRLEVEHTGLAALADEIVSHGPDVVVEEPPALREAVVARLRAVAGSGPGAGR